jgi:hypothetical protein
MPHACSIPLQREVGELEAGTSTVMAEHYSHMDCDSKPTNCLGLALNSASVNNGTVEKQGMTFEETSRSLSSHLPSNMSRRRATSQLASPIVDFDFAIAEKPYKQRQSGLPTEGPKCYYIINPRVPELAWYLTKEKNDSNSHEYEVESVPTHLVHIKQNRIGYLVETANRDEVTLAARNRPMSWTPKCQSGWSTTAVSSPEESAIDTEANPAKGLINLKEMTRKERLNHRYTMSRILSWIVEIFHA